MSEIPLPQGQAHLRFTIDLGVRLQVRLDWLTRWGYYHVELYREESLLLAGRGLHPGVDLLSDLSLGVGSLYLDGEEPTPANLGEANTLVHEP